MKWDGENSTSGSDPDHGTRAAVPRTAATRAQILCVLHGRPVLGYLQAIGGAFLEDESQAVRADASRSETGWRATEDSRPRAPSFIAWNFAATSASVVRPSIKSRIRPFFHTRPLAFQDGLTKPAVEVGTRVLRLAK